jgi:hypothetical protein
MAEAVEGSVVSASSLWQSGEFTFYLFNPNRMQGNNIAGSRTATKGGMAQSIGAHAADRGRDFISGADNAKSPEKTPGPAQGAQSAGGSMSMKEGRGGIPRARNAPAEVRVNLQGHQGTAIRGLPRAIQGERGTSDSAARTGRGGDIPGKVVLDSPQQALLQGGLAGVPDTSLICYGNDQL